MSGFVVVAVLAIPVMPLDPPVSLGDLARFGTDLDLAIENERFASQHCNWIAQICDAPGCAGLRPDLLARYGDRWPQIWYHHAASHRAAWCALRNALRGEWYGWSVDTTNNYLTQLRELIGKDAYHAGQMPPCVPYQFFRMR